jgi:hypothetical protein
MNRLTPLIAIVSFCSGLAATGCDAGEADAPVAVPAQPIDIDSPEEPNSNGEELPGRGVQSYTAGKQGGARSPFGSAPDTREPAAPVDAGPPPAIDMGDSCEALAKRAAPDVAACYRMFPDTAACKRLPPLMTRMAEIGCGDAGQGGVDSESRAKP